MAKLTSEQIKFLEHHKIALSKAYDAKRSSHAVYGPIMRALGLEVAYNVTPCQNGGHELRTRSGHCIVCKPANLSYQNRHSAQANIYVAWSRRSGIVKIGFSNDIQIREQALNSYEYGGQRDWEIVFHVFCKKAGKIEATAQGFLAPYSVSNLTYWKNDSLIDCRELFQCEIAVGIQAVEKAQNSVLGFIEKGRYYGPAQSMGAASKGAQETASSKRVAPASEQRRDVLVQLQAAHQSASTASALLAPAKPQRALGKQSYFAKFERQIASKKR